MLQERLVLLDVGYQMHGKMLNKDIKMQKVHGMTIRQHQQAQEQHQQMEEQIVHMLLRQEEVQQEPLVQVVLVIL